MSKTSPDTVGVETLGAYQERKVSFQEARKERMEAVAEEYVFKPSRFLFWCLILSFGAGIFCFSIALAIRLGAGL